MRFGVQMMAAIARADLEAAVRECRDLERRGFATASMPNAFALDAMTALAVMGRETERIELMTAVVPTYLRHPFSMAQQALSVQVASSGRFVLGVGLSHKVMIEDMLGLSYDRPARHMREYLEVLRPLLEGSPVSYQGELYRVSGGLQFSGVPRVPVLVAALGPAMLKVAGELSEGTITWMAGPKTLETHIVPRIREAAKSAGRPDPRVVAGIPVAITSRPDEAREKAAKQFQIYGTLPSYRAMLDREGAGGPADVAIVGDTAEVEAGLRRFVEAGVTDLGAVTFAADEGAVERTLEFLAAQT
jgi:F420-dependent oxidoreductase-like protein